MIITLMFLLLHSVFLYIILHLPLSIPYACSDTTLAALNLLLKSFSFASLVGTVNALSNHDLGGKAESPTVTKGTSPYSGNFKT